MMRRVLIIYGAMLAVSFTALAAGGAKSAQLPDADRQKLRERTSEYEQAWNQHDFQKMSSIYTQDATLRDAQGNEHQGQQAIRQQIRSEHEGPMKGTRTTLTLTEITPISPNAALLDIDQTVTGAEGMPGEQRSHVVVLATKVGNDWKVKAARVFPQHEPGQMGVGGAGMDPEQMRQHCERMMREGTGGAGMEQPRPMEPEPMPSDDPMIPPKD